MQTVQTFLAITCVVTRGEFDVISVNKLAATTAEQAANNFAATIADDAEAINVYNNLYTIIEADGETYTVIASTVNEFMQFVLADANMEYDAEYVLTTVNSML